MTFFFFFFNYFKRVSAKCENTLSKILGKFWENIREKYGNSWKNIFVNFRKSSGKIFCNSFEIEENSKKFVKYFGKKKVNSENVPANLEKVLLKPPVNYFKILNKMSTFCTNFEPIMKIFVERFRAYFRKILKV